MKTSSDKMYETYKDFDFTDAIPVAEIALLAKLQAEAGVKSRITVESNVSNSAMLVKSA